MSGPTTEQQLARYNLLCRALQAHPEIDDPLMAVEAPLAADFRGFPDSAQAAPPRPLCPGCRVRRALVPAAASAMPPTPKSPHAADVHGTYGGPPRFLRSALVPHSVLGAVQVRKQVPADARTPLRGTKEPPGDRGRKRNRRV